MNLRQPSKAKLASAVRDDWARALLVEFDAREKKLMEELLASSEPAAHNTIKGRVLELRDVKSLIVKIGELNGH